MVHSSLKTKMVVLMVCVAALATAPLIIYFVKTAGGLARLGTDPAVEAALARNLERPDPPTELEQAALALKKYRQIAALKSSIVRQVLTVSAAVSVSVLAAALALGYLFISRITRPLKELTDATRRLAQDNFNTPLDIQAGGEIGALVGSFNAMARDLALTRQQKLIAERRATWQRVARIIAHEIKNPLTPIKLSTERMYDKFVNNAPDFPAVIKSTTSTILSEIGNLQKLVETFHTYAKFPDPVLRPEPLNGIAAECVALFGGRDCAVEARLDDTAGLLRLDRGQIGEALANLVKNGIESTAATGRPGRVTVATARSAGAVTVTVSDNGCGIAAENREKLFQPYFTTKEQGSGIGLALTERIISLHGGTIGFESVEGAGTTFTITLPVEN